MAKPIRRSIVIENEFEQEFAAAPTTFVSAKREDGRQVREIPLANILPNPMQPRTDFDEGKMQELADSIREHGVISPVIVVPNDALAGSYFLVAGERRCRACAIIGLTTVPALVRESMEKVRLAELALIENVQRADLNPMETALAYQRLMEEYGLSQMDISSRTGKNQSSISRALQVLQAPMVAQEALQEGEIGMMTAVAMKGLSEAQAEPIVKAVKAKKMTQDEAKKEAKAKKKKREVVLRAEDTPGAYEAFDAELAKNPYEPNMHGAYDGEYEDGPLEPELRYGVYGTNGPETEDDYSSDYFVMDRDAMIDEITAVVTSDHLLTFNKNTLWNILGAIRGAELE